MTSGKFYKTLRPFQAIGTPIPYKTGKNSTYLALKQKNFVSHIKGITSENDFLKKPT